MTGWRIGYGVMNEELAQQITRLMINSNSCTAAFTQMAAIEALKGPQHDVEKMVKEFKERRDLIVDGLNSINKISCLKPKGSFYVFANVKKTGMDCKALADLILEKEGVACLSGKAFGEFGEGFIRFSYANSKENITKAIEKIKRLVEGL
jgi:aspartate/methionine/tyrosine aminotransferase